MTQTFQPGELINVQLRGVRYVRHEPDGALTIQTNDPDEHLWVLPPQAAIERVAPKEWPPRAGDVWADGDDSEWFAFAPRHQDGITLRPAVDMAFWAAPADLLAKHGPMRLVRRRGWTPEPPAEATPEQVDARAVRIAGLRAFADLLESRPDVPLPYGINGQVSFVGHDGLAEALQLAASLGVEFEALRDTGHQIQRWARSGNLDLGGDVTLTLYVHGLDAPAPADGPMEVVADEPTGPVPLVGVEPAGPIAPHGCDDCCAEPGEPHAWPGCPGAAANMPAEAGGETVEDAEVTS